jgi:hypothetical protein
VGGNWANKAAKEKRESAEEGLSKKTSNFFFEKSAFLDFANQENWSVQGVSPL